VEAKLLVPFCLTVMILISQNFLIYHQLSSVLYNNANFNH